MGQNPPKNGNFQKWSPTVREGQLSFLGHFRRVGTRFQPFPAVLAHVSPEPSPSGSHLQGPKGPNMAQNHPKRVPVTPGSAGSPDRVQRGYPRSPPDNCQLPTANCQPIIAKRHQPPPTANRQPPTAANLQPPYRQSTTRSDRHKNGQTCKFSKVVPDPWGGSN